MKTLVLVRHGKSDRNYEGGLQRPLSLQGWRDSERMAETFHEFDLEIDAVFSSPALRAKSTAECFAGWMQLPVSEDDRLYDAGASELLDVVQETEDFCDTILLVGHNPGISEFLRVLLDSDYSDMSPASVAVLNFDVPEWVDVVAGIGELEWFMTPKMLGPESRAA
jgi:phosphohistidine phosphatase